MKKLFTVTSFFLGVPLLILVSLAYLSFISYEKQSGHVLGSSTRGIAYAALPPEGERITNEIVPAESKTELVRQFFAK